MLIESTIVLANGAASHKGIIINGYQHDIHDNVIHGGSPGILGTNSLANTPVVVLNTDFVGGNTGIKVQNLGLSTQGCLFSGAKIGIDAVDASVGAISNRFSACNVGLQTVGGTAGIARSTFNGCGIGWNALELTQVSSIGSSDILGNGIGVRVDGPATLEAGFNSIKFNNHGLELANGAILDMDNNSQNEFQGNAVSIYLSQAGRPLLTNGDNDFYPDNTISDGFTFEGTIKETLSCGAATFDPNISAVGNTWYYTYVIGTGWLGLALANGPYSITAVNTSCTYYLQ
jgi:hypothetical protein